MKNSIVSGKRLLIGFTVLFTILSLTGSCKKTMDNMNNTGGGPGTGGTGGPGTNEVWIQSMAFSPSVITIAAGATITWTNKDAVAHTVTSDNGLFDSSTISGGGTYSHMFATPGTYLYHCAFHLSMTAKVIVN
jgi:plastocyanin